MPRVELGVHHTAASAHPLHVAGLDGRTAAHAVLVRNGAVQHIGDDLHVPMAVRAEAAAGSNAVVIDHAQCAEAHVSRVVVVGEGEGMAGGQPAMLGQATGSALADLQHDGISLFDGFDGAGWGGSRRVSPLERTQPRCPADPRCH
ncbi:hypothetical protein G6F22_017554 [Rhizopus arrhizus]|nr:hypothetical protein G6F22_017554 [Rhizopus arrhizus]